jgi:hypothetical protein
VQWIMARIAIVRYSVHFNNVPLEPFTPSHGLHQGDSLSPYLFLFVADGLSQLLHKELRQQNLHEVHICHRALGISHLLFADDTLLFFKASEGQVEIINTAIKVFERGTCQLVNTTKCSMMFRSSCSSHNKKRVLQILNVSNTTVEEKYLGLPTPGGRMNKGKFKMYEERLVKRCSGWAEKNMSMGAKEALIKSVAQAISTYIMGVFKLSTSTCEQMTQLIRRFWWDEENGHQKVHWIAWDKLLAPKSADARGGG